jgi:alkylation response protein AidB-like acyl-CoA dehydrogenase
MIVAGHTGLRADRDKYRDFVDSLVVPYADEFDQAGILPEELLKNAAACGMWGVAIKHGTPADATRMQRLGVLHEELGRGCSSLRSLFTVHSMVAFAVERWASHGMKQRWLRVLAHGTELGAFCLSENDAGSDIARITTTARSTPTGFVLNGHKRWVTGGQLAGLLLVFARTDRGISAFLVQADTPGVQRTSVAPPLGTRASMLAEIRFTDCVVPRDALVGMEGMGIGIATGVLDIGRYSVAAGCIGIVQASLEASLDHAAHRIQGGGPLKDHQLVQRLITNMETSARAGRLLCREAGRLKDEGDPATIVATCVAKYFASQAASQAAADAVQIYGASGCAEGHRVSRYFRDAKVMEIIEGSSQIQQTLIAQAAFQGHRDPLLDAVDPRTA